MFFLSDLLFSLDWYLRVIRSVGRSVLISFSLRLHFTRDVHAKLIPRYTVKEQNC